MVEGQSNNFPELSAEASEPNRTSHDDPLIFVRVGEEPMMLTAAELDHERNPSHDFPRPHAWIRYPSRAVQVRAHAVAWTRTAVKKEVLRSQGTDATRGLVWTSAVTPA